MRIETHKIPYITHARQTWGSCEEHYWKNMSSRTRVVRDLTQRQEQRFRQIGLRYWDVDRNNAVIFTFSSFDWVAYAALSCKEFLSPV
jgi:hypothetical protein